MESGRVCILPAWLNAYRDASATDVKRGEIVLKKIFWGLLYLIWAVLIVSLFSGILDSGEGELLTPEDLLSDIDIAAESAWMGIYLRGNRIGYVHSELSPIESGGYSIQEFSQINASMMGAEQTMRISMNVTADSTLALIKFKGQLDAAPYSTSFTGELNENVLSIKIATAGKVTERFFPAPEPIYLSQVIKPLLQSGKLDEGDSIKLASFDPVSMQMQEMVVIGGGREKRMFKGEDIHVRKLITRLAGFESTIFVDSDGNTIEEHGPMGILMRREEMEQALDIEGGSGSVDFLAIYAVKPEGTIRAPRKTVRALFRISNVSLDRAVASSDRQRIIDRSEGIIEVLRDPRPGKLSEHDLKIYSSDAPFIESRDSRIRRAAKEAMQGGTSRLDSLQRLTSWVFRTVDKKMAAGLPSALAVLKIKQGDCNEHAILFTALARSVGIPTRMQLGLVYQAGSFYYHAWTASWIEDRWVEFEPTFGLESADAARIALTAGDLSNSIELAGAIGKIEIEILDVE